MYEKSLEMSHFRVFRTRRSQSWPLPWAAGVARGMERMKETAPTEAFGCTMMLARHRKRRSWMEHRKGETLSDSLERRLL